jgi:transcriptional regulator with XRE-family HTH domain
MQLRKVFGLNVRRLRKRRGLSIEALADQIDVAYTYVGQLERGQRNPTLAMVEKFAGALDASPIDLLTSVSVEDGPELD